MIDTTKYEFLTAHFSNNERTIVTSYWGNAGETIEITVKAEEGNENWATLLEYVDIDTLHEWTYKHIRDQVEAYENQVIRIAKERGMIYDINDIDSQLYEVLAKILFKEYDHKKDKEKLFMFKLQLFELDFVKQCTDNDLKRNLRKAENFIDAISITIEIKNSL
jgi:hypothetical protein